MHELPKIRVTILSADCYIHQLLSTQLVANLICSSASNLCPLIYMSPKQLQEAFRIRQLYPPTPFYSFPVLPPLLGDPSVLHRRWGPINAYQAKLWFVQCFFTSKSNDIFFKSQNTCNLITDSWIGMQF